MVVDDERDARIATRRIREQSGHEVVEASTGKESIAVLESTAVDLVITDIMIPGQSGVASLAQMRELYSGLRVIATSTHTLAELPEAKRMDAARAIVKPFTVDTLTNFNIGFLEKIDESPEEEEEDSELLAEDIDDNRLRLWRQPPSLTSNGVRASELTSNA